MSDIEPRRGAQLTRAQREQRAYRLVLATGAFGVLAIVGLVLAMLDVIGAGLPLLAAVFAVICFVLLRRTLGR